MTAERQTDEATRWTIDGGRVVDDSRRDRLRVGLAKVDEAFHRSPVGDVLRSVVVW